MIRIILTFGLGMVFSFCIIGILVEYWRRKRNINIEKVVIAKAEKDGELPSLVKEMINDEAKKLWAANRKGLSRPINVFDDKERKIVYLTVDDWCVVSEALMRLSGTQEINCAPIKNSLN